MEPTTLALAPYSQRLGIAVLKRSELLGFSVKTFVLPRTTESVTNETRKALVALIDLHRPTLILVKALSKRQRASANQRAVVDETMRVAADFGIRVLQLGFDEAKRIVVNGTKPTDRETFGAIKGFYPEVARLTDFQNRHQREYYRPLLAAVTLGISKTAGI